MVEVVWQGHCASFSCCQGLALNQPLCIAKSRECFQSVPASGTHVRMFIRQLSFDRFAIESTWAQPTLAPADSIPE